MSEQYAAGRILRANGRYSITHQWLLGSPEIRTRCGLLYEAQELYDPEPGEQTPSLFVVEGPGDLAMLRCRDCFENGTAGVLRS